MLASGFSPSFPSKSHAHHKMDDRKFAETYTCVSDIKQFIHFLMGVVRSSYLEIFALSIHGASLLCISNNYCVPLFYSESRDPAEHDSWFSKGR